MKADDRTIRHQGGADRDQAKVVRLSDWLAPDDELVPFGPRAHAQNAVREPSEQTAGAAPDLPPASGFWDGDTSVHTAVPGPGIFDEPDENPPSRSLRQRRHLTTRRPPLAWRPHARDAIADLADRRSWRLLAGALAFVGLAVVVLVVVVGGGSSPRSSTPLEAGIGDQPEHAGSTPLSASVAGSGHEQVTRRATRAIATTGTAAERARSSMARPHRRPLAAVKHTAPASPSMSTPAVTTATSVYTPNETTTAPTATEPVPTTPAPAPAPAPPSTGGVSSAGGGSGSGSGSTSSSNSGSGSGSGSRSGSGKQPAFGPTGSLAPGSSPNG